MVHPGNVKLLSTGQVVSVDAGTLASYYGLSPGDYDVAPATRAEQENSTDGVPMHIHLFPREDGRYYSIKTRLGDNGTDYHYDKIVGWKKKRAERLREAGL